MKRKILLIPFVLCSYVYAMEPIILSKKILLNKEVIKLKYNEQQKALIFRSQTAENTCRDIQYPIYQFTDNELLDKVSITIKGLAQLDTFILGVFVASVNKMHKISLVGFHPNNDLPRLNHVATGCICGIIQEISLAHDQNKNIAVTYFCRVPECISEYSFTIDNAIREFVRKTSLVKKYIPKIINQ